MTFLLHIVQTGSGTRAASYKIDTGRFYPGNKTAGHEVDREPPSRAEVKNYWSYTLSPTHDFVAGTGTLPLQVSCCFLLGRGIPRAP